MSSTVTDQILDEVLELDKEESGRQQDMFQFVSTNGAYSPNIHTNGGEPSQMDGQGNGYYSHYPFSGNGDQPFDISKVSYEDIITEDDEPVDNFPSEKQQRLLVRPLYSSSHIPRPMIAAANVGIFYNPLRTPIVPDMFLSLEATMPPGHEFWDKENRTYYVWKHGKSPEVAVEIVSNKKGGEGGLKFDRYATLGVRYYVILDHLHEVQEETLTVYELVNGRYVARGDYRLPDVNLSLTFWEGEYEDVAWEWLRWSDLAGNIIPTAAEEAERERLNAQLAQADAEQAQADSERERQEKELALEQVEKVEAEFERERQEKELALGQVEKVEADAERERQEKELALGQVEKAEAETERERQEKELALERAEKAEAESMRKIEQILAQARAAGVNIDINDLT